MVGNKEKIFTLKQALADVPVIENELLKLKAIRKRITEEENVCDAEELASYGLEGAEAKRSREKMDHSRSQIKRLEKEFENLLGLFQSSGWLLRSLDPAIVDFASIRRNTMIYFCWKEGESEVCHWHPGADGCKNRLVIKNDLREGL